MQSKQKHRILSLMFSEVFWLVHGDYIIKQEYTNRKPAESCRVCVRLCLVCCLLCAVCVSVAQLQPQSTIQLIIHPSQTKSRGERQKPFSHWAASRQFGRPFCGLVRGFRQKAINWVSVLVRQFDASEGTLFSTSIAMLISNCVRWPEVSMTCTWEFQNQKNSWSQQSVHHFIRGRQDE